MIPQAMVVHSVAERVRLRIPAMRGDAAFFTLLHEKLSSCPAVAKVETNPLTAGVLLFLQPGADVRQVGEFGNGQALFELDTPGNDGIVAMASKGLAETSMQLRTVSGVDLQSLILLGLLGMGFYQLWRGRFLAPATTLLWYAYQLIQDETRHNSRTTL